MNKKILYFLGGLILIIFLAALLVPQFFEDDIKAAIDRELNKSLKAEVYFDTDNFGLSFFKNFPHLTASLHDFGIIGKAPFEGDTLLSVKAFEISVNVGSLFGDQMKIDDIYLKRPEVFVMVLDDSTANYDIYLASDTAALSDTTSTAFSLAIDHWQIEEGSLIYADQPANMLVVIKGLYHEGSGDFNQDIFDLTTLTRIDTIDIVYDEITYLKNKQIEADMTLLINNQDNRYSFQDNRLAVNEFGVTFDGDVALEDEDILFNLSFSSAENNFKSLLSLIPPEFLADYKDLETTGSIGFDGELKGTYNEDKLPGFGLQLIVENGQFKYPDLPVAATDIQIDVTVENKTGVVENTKIDLKNFHVNLGNNPVEATAFIEQLYPTRLDANLMARLNLEDLSSIFPMEGISYRGMLSANVKASGVYDSVEAQLPKLDGDFRLENGYVKTIDPPVEIEDIQARASIINTTGNYQNTTIRLNPFQFSLAGDEVRGTAVFEDLNNYTWNVDVEGRVDLEKLTQVYPINGTTLRGALAADVTSKGNMAALEAERYDQLPTSGYVELNDFFFSDRDIPQGVRISQASAQLSPNEIKLSTLEGAIGESNVRLKGSLSNYLQYLSQEQALLKGNLSLASDRFDLNPFMTDEEPSDDAGEEVEYSTFEVPKNIDFAMNAQIDEVLYENLTLKDATGQLIIQNGVLAMDGIRFSSLGGLFKLAGSYSTQDMDHPRFDMDFNIEHLGFSKAYQHFNTIQAFAPVAEKLSGNFNTQFALRGELGDDMSLDYPTLQGEGIIEVLDAAITDSKIIEGVSQLTRFAETDEIRFKDLILQAEIRNGRFYTDPFPVNWGGYEATLSGSTGVDGSIDYTLAVEIPTGKLGDQANQFLSQYTSKAAIPQEVTLPVRITGTYDDPKFGQGKAVSDGKEATVSESIKESAQTQTDSLKKEATEQVKEEVEESKEEVEEKVEEKTEELKKKAKDKLKDLFGN